MTKEDEAAQSRRDFLKLAGAGAAATAAAVATGEAAAAEAVTVETEGYRETAHVSAYYQSCRF